MLVGKNKRGKKVSRGGVRPKRASPVLDRITPASQKLAIAAATPFNMACKGVYLANEHAKPSLKSNALTRFTVSGNAGDTVFLMLGPQLTSDDPSLAVAIVPATNLGTSIFSGTPTTLVTPVRLPHMYNNSAVADDKTLGVRGSVAGLQIKYTGQTLQKGGSWSFLKLSDYVPLVVNSSQAGLGPFTDSNTWSDLKSFVASSRLTRITSLNQSITQEMSLIARPDAKFSSHSDSDLGYPFITSTPVGVGGGASQTVEVAGSSTALMRGGIFGIAVFTIKDSLQEFTMQLIGHMEQKSDALYQVHTPSPAHVQDHATIHQAIDKAHETHNDVPEKPLLHHLLDTIKTEAASVVTKTGRSLFAGLMSEIRKPSNYEAAGLAAMSMI